MILEHQKQESIIDGRKVVRYVTIEIDEETNTIEVIKIETDWVEETE